MKHNYSAKDFILDLNPVPSWIFEIKTQKIVDANNAACLLFGYSKTEFIKLSLPDLCPTDDIQQNLKSLETDLKIGSVVDLGTCEHFSKDKKKLCLDTKGTKITFDNQEAIIAVAQDVTAREKQLLQLKKSDQKLNAVSAIAKIGYWRLELDRKTLTWTDQVYHIWNRDKTFKVSYDNFLKTIHPDDLSEFQKKQELAFSGKTSFDHIHRIILPNKEIRYIHELGRLTKDENGKLVAFEGTSQDVTLKVKEEQQLKLLNNVISNTHDPIMIAEVETHIAKDAKIIYVNQAFSDMTGYTTEEVIGKSPRILEGPNSNQKQIQKLRQSLRNWEQYEITILNYKKNGDEFWNNISYSPVANEKGRYTYWVAILRNVTKQKVKEQENKLLRKISLNFSSNSDFSTVNKELCKSVAEFGDFEVVELWLLNIENKHLHLESYYTKHSADEAVYDTRLPYHEFTKNEGFIGQVWNSKQHLFLKNVQSNPQFIRNEFAEKLGLSSMYGLPLTLQKDMVGVLTIGSKQSDSFLKKHSDVFKKLKSFIGSEIIRKKLEHDLNYLYDSVPDMICIIDSDGKVLKMNSAGLAIIGFKPEDILFHKFIKFVHSEDKARFKNTFLTCSEQINIRNFDIRIINSKEEVIWLNWTCTKSSESDLLHVIAKDMTTEKKLLQLNSQASKLAKIGSWEIDLLHNKHYWSEMVHHIHESDPETFTPSLETAISQYGSDFQSMVNEKVDRLINFGEAMDFEAVIVTQNQQEKWVRCIGDAEMNDGVCQRIFGSFQDIHERKEVELRLKSLADDLPGVVYQIKFFANGERHLSQVSKQAVDVWGFTAEEVIENDELIWNQMEAGGDAELLESTILESISNKTKWSARWKYVMPDGRLKTHMGYGTPTFYADGSVVFNAMTLDITQEAKNEELLEEATEMAMIGSWEIDLNYENENRIYWSPIIKEILEVDPEYNPSETGGFEFYTPESKIKMQRALQKLINHGVSFDLELIFITTTGKEKWVRCIGKRVLIKGEYTKIRGSVQDITESKLLELRISEILGSISDAFYAVDDNWNITYFNEEAQRLLTTPASAVLGKNFWEMFPQAGALMEDTYRRVAKLNQPESFEFVYALDNHWYEVNVYPSNQGLSVYFKNINLRKKQEQDLKVAYDEKNAILESIGDGFFTVDNSWTVTYWNKQAEFYLNLPKQEIIGQNLWDIFSINENLHIYQEYNRAVRTGKTVTFQHHDQAIDKWFELTAYPSFNALSVYFKDITLKKTVDQRVILANERFEKVAEATNDAIWDWDLIENTQYWGKGFKTLFGYNLSKKEETLRSWTKNIHPKDRSRIMEGLDALLYNSKINHWSAEHRYKKRDGSYSHVLNKGLVIRDKNEQAIRMVGAITDITEVKKHEMELNNLNKSLKTYAVELERSNEELEQFAYISSHDLQEPLRMISSFMDLLKKKYGAQLDDKALEYIYYATDGAKRMKQIILDLLQYSKAMRPTEDTEEINLEELISEYKLLRRKIILEKNVEIVTTDLPVIKNYRAALSSILYNLLDNAIKYSRDDITPQIQIKTTETPELWTFTIQDNGIGIDTQFFDKIFVMFQRLHNRDEYDGTGIGLSIAKRNIEFLGGKIWVESTVGKGTTFFFTIPKNK